MGQFGYNSPKATMKMALACVLEMVYNCLFNATFVKFRHFDSLQVLKVTCAEVCFFMSSESVEKERERERERESRRIIL